MIGWSGDQPGWTTAGAIALVIAVSTALWIPAVALINSQAYLIGEKAKFITAYNGADPETRDALGLKYPTIRVRMNGDAKVYVDYSGVELKWFRRFMQDSTLEYISAESHWNDKTTARKQWHAWYKYLLDERAIIPESQTGNKTWRWRSANEYRRLNIYTTMRIPRDMLPPEERTPDELEALPELPNRAKIEFQFESETYQIKRGG